MLSCTKKNENDIRYNTKWRLTVKKLIVLTILIAMLSLSNLALADVDLENTNSLLVRLPFDFNLEVSHMDMIDFPSDGPQSFYIDNNNQIYILNTLANKINLYNSNGKILKNYEINDAERLIDLTVKDGLIYALDANEYVFVIDEKGDILKKIAVKNGNWNKEIVTINNKQSDRYFKPIALDSSKDRVSVIFQNDNMLYLDDIEKSIFKFKKRIGVIKRESMNYVSKNTVLAEHDNAVYSLEANVIQNGSLNGEVVIRKSNTEGKAIAYFKKMKTGIYLPNRSIAVSDTGKVYQMVIQDKELLIYQLNEEKNYIFDSAKYSKMKDATAEFSASSLVEPRTRSSVYDRAYAMVNYSWTFNRLENGIENSSSITIPYYLRKYTDNNDHAVEGIPYCWGGYDSFDSHSDSQTWTSFPDAISKGKIAGNVHTSGHNYIGGTTGIDCSGFVSAAYGYTSNPKKNVSQIFAYFNEVDTPFFMDAIKVPGHIMLYEAQSPESDYKGIWVLDSSTGEGKTASQWRSYTWLIDRGAVYGEYQNIN